MTASAFPLRDDAGTTRRARRCAGCGGTFTPTGRQLHCSTACRKRVFRARRGAVAAVMTSPPTGNTRRERTVYECGSCGQRRLGVQRCEECGTFGRAAGLGADCPHCGEPVTAADLGLTSGAPR